MPIDRTEALLVTLFMKREDLGDHIDCYFFVGKSSYEEVIKGLKEVLCGCDLGFS